MDLSGKAKKILSGYVQQTTLDQYPDSAHHDSFSKGISSSAQARSSFTFELAYSEKWEIRMSSFMKPRAVDVYVFESIM